MATSRYKYKVFEYKKCIRKKEFEIKRERERMRERVNKKEIIFLVFLTIEQK